MHGEPIVVEGTELLARALQHETDHLNGILFIDRLSSEDRKKAMKEIRESDWFGLASSTGSTPTIKISPHGPFGQGL
jgi:peptide deformylase